MKSMFRDWSKRAVEQELMDDFTIGGDELREALRHLRRLNRIFAAAAPTLYGIERLYIEADKPTRLSILDIGSGSGDVNRRLLQWADANRIEIAITLVDITTEACEEAIELFQAEPRVHVTQSDLFDVPERSVDIVTGTQFLHHFSDDELPAVILKMLAIARIGVVINDIHRHWLAWAAVWLMARFLSSNRYILNDGPLSVAKGFQAEDWERLKHSLGEKAELSYSWRPLFRYAVVIRQPRHNPLVRGRL
ncbi:2-polyprenyl-3-methyl-5-hydroxy-6-metoxy-1,4-benzoquinol methylase [Paenibacillus harenae]|uniref:2-polyprenyl-3-methyl-5-hydroxy-6-metoxy-1, 4-benzoquinol methylase n=2 Tax=Paenibacillus harenae TaxID=306543 RepID=A0ABT9TVY6_PAEHA|nr:2-polyprenyl-3-methyl-5-hydroxy-6-metoxy-1,4-benzoquinol methylase [Paenibacillus harenae]